MNEADTCRKFVVPLLQKAGWDNDPHSIAEQRYFTAGRIVSQGPTARRRPGKRADYLLRYTRDLPLAVVEAKAWEQALTEGVGQAKNYADKLAIRFAYSSNGQGVYGIDGVERILVENQDNCRKGCPACSRVCPEQAIMFPDYKTPASSPGKKQVS